MASAAQVCTVSLFSLVRLTSHHRDWVANCLGKMSDSNSAEAQGELRQVISDAFMNKTLWTTDWNGVQLQRYGLPTDQSSELILLKYRSLISNPALSLNPLNNLKRKM